MRELFNKIIVQLLKPLSHRIKRQLLLNNIGVNWYTKEINEKLPPLQKQKPKKKNNRSRIKLE